MIDKRIRTSALGRNGSINMGVEMRISNGVSSVHLTIEDHTGRARALKGRLRPGLQRRHYFERTADACELIDLLHLNSIWLAITVRMRDGVLIFEYLGPITSLSK